MKAVQFLRLTPALALISGACGTVVLSAQTTTSSVQQLLDSRATAEKQLAAFDAFAKANVPNSEQEIRKLDRAKAEALVAQLRALAAPVVQARNADLYNPSALQGKTVPLSNRFPKLHVNAAIRIHTMTPSEGVQTGGISLPLVKPLGITGQDADLDGLDDGFEAELADAFKFTYKVSNNENSGTGFATFYDSVPQVVQQTFGPTPPRLYYRVRPLGYTIGSDSQYYNLIQIDYLTAWNRDDGLITGAGCTAAYGIFFELAGVATSYVLNGQEEHPRQ